MLAGFLVQAGIEAHVPQSRVVGPEVPGYLVQANVNPQTLEEHANVLQNAFFRFSWYDVVNKGEFMLGTRFLGATFAEEAVASATQGAVVVVVCQRAQQPGPGRSAPLPAGEAWLWQQQRLASVSGSIGGSCSNNMSNICIISSDIGNTGGQ
jgi:hypothetical protein